MIGFLSPAFLWQKNGLLTLSCLWFSWQMLSGSTILLKISFDKSRNSQNTWRRDVDKVPISISPWNTLRKIIRSSRHREISMGVLGATGMNGLGEYEGWVRRDPWHLVKKSIRVIICRLVFWKSGDWISQVTRVGILSSQMLAENTERGYKTNHEVWASTPSQEAPSQSYLALSLGQSAPLSPFLRYKQPVYNTATYHT